jgi:hypothetical protein
MSLPVNTNKTQPLTRGIVNCRCSAYSSGTALIKSSYNLTGKYYAICHYSYNLPLCVSVKKNDTADNLLLKDRKRKNDIMNSQRTKLHIRKPRHIPIFQSGQKSCFLADTPEDNCIFVDINKLID